MWTLMTTVFGAFVGGIILIRPVMRSLRVVVAVTTMTVVAIAVGVLFLPPVRGNVLATLIVTSVGIGLILAPLWICSRFARSLSALDPVDFDENERVHETRAALTRVGSGTAADRILRELESYPLPHPVWLDVRIALRMQCDELTRFGPDPPPGARGAVVASRQRLMQTWRAAIASRARFLR